MKKILLIISLFAVLVSCTKKDNHPEVQYLSDLVNNKKILQKIEIDSIYNENMKFLKSDKILLQTYDALQNIKIIDLNQNVIFEKKCNPKIKIYIDKNGNIFCDNMKYFYPDYKKSVNFEVIDIYKLINEYKINLEKITPNNDSIFDAKSKIYAKNFIKKNNLKISASFDDYEKPNYNDYPKTIQDSIAKFDKQLYAKYPYRDSLITKKTKDFEKLLAAKYKFKPLGRIETGNFIEEQNGQLIFYREGNFVNEFVKDAKFFEYFDESILVDYYPSGKLFGTISLYYYQLTNKTRFKDYDSSVFKYTIDKKNYMHSKSFGLYFIK